MHICTVYVDDQDPTCTGWAWRMDSEDQRESGSCDDPEDGAAQCAACLPDGVVPGLGGWTYHDHGGAERYEFVVEDSRSAPRT